MSEHAPSCPRLQFWDAGEWEAPCTCPESDDQPKRPDVEGLRKDIRLELANNPRSTYALVGQRRVANTLLGVLDYIEALERDLVTASEIAWEGLEDLLSGCEANNGEPCDENLAPCVAHQGIRGIRRRYPHLFGEGE